MQRGSILHREQRSYVTEWILGSARVASLLAPPVDDDRRDALANYRTEAIAMLVIVASSILDRRTPKLL
ncbi:hypothetical protein CK219_29300 [Mesorhizobium sp. WSM4313]|nr:hypothetical protein CK219_29300 [Mesorhizobium sp. WSM4313]